MRALLVDDERLARRELRRLLAAHPEIEIVGEAANAEEARAALREVDPDLLFLDVQMPRESGFDLLESLDSVPLVVFTTAFDEYALKAFDVSALDYLVKPIEPARLARAVSRLLASETKRARTAGGASADGAVSAGAGASGGEGASDGAGGAAGAGPSPSGVLTEHHRVFLKDGDRCWFIELGKIHLFESMDNYTQVHLGDESPLILRSLNELEEKLEPRVFFRANRSQIVNLNAVRSIHSWFGGRLMAKLEGGHEVVLSRRRTKDFRERMSV